MMATLDELVYYIDTNSTVFTAATNLFGAKLPDSAPDSSIVVLESGGIPPADSYGSKPVFESPNVQVISRSTAYTTARSRAETIYRLLHSVSGASLSSSSGSTSSTTYLSIQAIQQPFSIGLDSEGRSLISCNFMVRKELS